MHKTIVIVSLFLTSLLSTGFHCGPFEPKQPWYNGDTSRLIFSSRYPYKPDTVPVALVPEYFILGMRCDYMGRTDRMKGDSTLVDMFDSEQRLISEFLRSYADSAMNIVIDVVEDNGLDYLHSQELADIINSFYDGDTILDSLFTSAEHYYSFLTGCYLREGSARKGICSFSMPNGGYKATQVNTALWKLRIADVLFQMLQNFVPVGYEFYFIPNERLHRYLMLVDDVVQQQERIDRKHRYERTKYHDLDVKLDERLDRYFDMIRQIFGR